MIRRRLRLLSLPLLALPLAVLLLAGGCSKRPDEPGFDNPFDPSGPDAGDPFGLQARISGSNVLLTWSRPDHPDVASYNVLHSLDGASFTLADTAAVTGQPNEQYIHTEPAHNALNYYKVQARNALGQATGASQVAAASVLALPFLEIADGASGTATRFVSVAFSSQTGETAELDSVPEFTSPLVTAPAPDDEVVTVDWDLGPAYEADQIKRVYLRIGTGGAFSETVVDSIRVQFRPSFAVAGNPATVASRDVELSVASSGVSLMRFAASSGELEAAAWVPGAESITYRLDEGLGSQIIYGEFQSDFGLEPYYVTTTTVVPDDLSGAGFVIDADAELTDTAAVEIHSDAAALWMRFAEGPDLSGAPWLAYADTHQFLLSPEGGLKVVYGQFRNDWSDSPVLSDAITLVARDLDVSIVAPADGAVLRGATPFQVSGIALPASGGPAVDVVELDFGSGWVLAGGTGSWSLVWDVPAVTADSTATIRARATADTLTATVQISVTLTQMQVRFTGPEDGEDLVGGRQHPLSGTAAPATGGPAIRLVEVNTGDGWQVATGTESWSFPWDAPAVAGATPVTLQARAWADGESAVAAVSVTLQPE